MIYVLHIGLDEKSKCGFGDYQIDLWYSVVESLPEPMSHFGIDWVCVSLYGVPVQYVREAIDIEYDHLSLTLDIYLTMSLNLWPPQHVWPCPLYTGQYHWPVVSCFMSCYSKHLVYVIFDHWLWVQVINIVYYITCA